jgi:hypothetical protein
MTTPQAAPAAREAAAPAETAAHAWQADEAAAAIGQMTSQDGHHEAVMAGPAFHQSDRARGALNPEYPVGGLNPSCSCSQTHGGHRP